MRNGCGARRTFVSYFVLSALCFVLCASYVVLRTLCLVLCTCTLSTQKQSTKHQAPSTTNRNSLRQTTLRYSIRGRYDKQPVAAILFSRARRPRPIRHGPTVRRATNHR